MIKVSVLYPNREGTKFDIAYYLNHHIPMVRQLLGSALEGVSVEHGISGEEPGSPAPYVTTCHLMFDFSSSLSNELRLARAGDHRRHPEVHELRATHSDRGSQALAMATNGGLFRKCQSARDPEAVCLCAL